MKRVLFVFLCRVNFLFPNIIGLRYLIYKFKRIKHNFYSYDQKNDLIKTVNFAIENTPYYKNRYDKKISSIDEFQSSIKLIDKDEVMNSWDEFQTYPKSSGTSKTTTGGTSGKPLNLIQPKNRFIFELATIHTIWSFVGWKGHIRGVIRNTKLENNQPYRVNPITREFIFDGFNTSKDYFLTIFKTLKRNNIKFVHAYPSTAYQFSRFLKNENLDYSFINAFLCGSEGLLDFQKHFIVDQLGIKVYNWYGHSEKLIIGGYCKNSDNIHIEPTYGYFELVSDDGNLINQPGEIGEMIGTTFHNKYMPLIRYKTGDFAEYGGNYCPNCKRNLPVLKKIYGRWDKNRIYKKDGSYITTTALNLHSELYTKIEGFQYFQNEYGKLKVRIIKGENFKEEDHIKFYNHFKNAYGKENEVEIVYNESLEMQNNGKFLSLISKIKNKI
jgi:phenylacetate-CoA ligase